MASRGLLHAGGGGTLQGGATTPSGALRAAQMGIAGSIYNGRLGRGLVAPHALRAASASSEGTVWATSQSTTSTCASLSLAPRAMASL